MSGDIPQGNATYDSATANAGSPWKIPTKAQYQELRNNTTYQWTTMNGVNGGKYTSKSNSSKYIFFPAAGLRYDTTHNNAGSSGIYWSTTLYSSYSAWHMDFYSSNDNIGYNNRRFGYSVRGIQ